MFCQRYKKALSLLAGLFATAVLAPTGAWGQESFIGPETLFAPCETASLDAGTPGVRWNVPGLRATEATSGRRSFVTTPPRWVVRLLLSEAGPRKLVLKARALRRSVVLRAIWNGTDLGTQTFSTRWQKASWSVPVEAVSPGLNRIELHAADEVSSVASVPRQVLKVDQIMVRPATKLCSAKNVVVRRVEGLPLDLPRGAILVTRARGASRAILLLSGESKAVVETHLADISQESRTQTVTVSKAGSFAGLELDLAREPFVTLLARGPGNLRIERADLQPKSIASWRRQCDSLSPTAVAGLWLAALPIGLLLIRRLSKEPRAVWLDPILILSVALSVRWLFVVYYPSTGVRRFSDSWEYVYRARLLLEGTDFLTDTSWHQWQAWLRPPGYFLFLAGILKWSHHGLDTLVRVQAVFSALTAAISYYIAYPLFGRNAAIVTGLMVALNAHSVMSASWVLSEVLFTAVLVVGLAFLAWGSTRLDWRLASAAGFCLGCAALIRPTPITFVPLAALCLVPALGRKGLVSAVAMVAAMLAVTVPWSVRNGLVLDRAPVFETSRVANFLLAHPDDAIIRHSDLDLANPESRKAYYFGRLMKNRRANENSVSDFAVFTRGFSRMLRTPIETLSKFTKSLRIYFSGFPLDFARSSLAESDNCRAVGWTDSLNVTWWLSFGLAVCGVLWAVPDRRAWPVLLWFFYLTVITNLFFFHGADPGRFRFPLHPVIAVFGGHFVAKLIGTLRGFSKKNQRVAI